MPADGGGMVPGNQVLFTPLPNPAPCFLLDFYWSVTSSRPSGILNCSRDREFFKITLVGWLLPAIDLFKVATVPQSQKSCGNLTSAHHSGG